MTSIPSFFQHNYNSSPQNFFQIDSHLSPSSAAGGAQAISAQLLHRLRRIFTSTPSHVLVHAQLLFVFFIVGGNYFGELFK